MAGYPADHYVTPEPQSRLSDDRSKLIIKQELPGVRKDDVDVDVHENGWCLEFTPSRGKQPVHRCRTLRYEVDPSGAVAEWKDGVLFLAIPISEHMTGTKVKVK